MVEGDLAKQAIVARSIRLAITVITDSLCSQHPHHEFVDGRQLAHEIPGVFAVSRLRENHGLQFVVGFGAQNFEAGASATARFIHSSSLRRRVERALRRAYGADRQAKS